MKTRILHYSKEILLFIFVITLFANILSLYKSQSLNKEKLFLLTSRLIDNSLYHITEDKPIMVHIWATWCPVCKAEIDNIQRISNYYEVITIAVNSGTDYDITTYLKENNLDLKVINDTDGLLAHKLNIAVYPTTLIYDREKNLVFSEVGYTSTIGLWLRMLWSS